MNVMAKLHKTFKQAQHTSGYISKQQLELITKNNTLIREIAIKYGFNLVYKHRSKTILGYGNYKHSDKWLSAKLDRTQE